MAGADDQHRSRHWSRIASSSSPPLLGPEVPLAPWPPSRTSIPRASLRSRPLTSCGSRSATAAHRRKLPRGRSTMCRSRGSRFAGSACCRRWSDTPSSLAFGAIRSRRRCTSALPMPLDCETRMRRRRPRSRWSASAVRCCCCCRARTIRCGRRAKWPPPPCPGAAVPMTVTSRSRTPPNRPAARLARCRRVGSRSLNVQRPGSRAVL